MPYGDFDPWGLEDQLSSGELAYQYGGNTYGDLSPGQQEWNFDFGNWNYSPDTSNAWNTDFNLDFNALQSQQPNFNFNQQELPPLDFNTQFPQLQTPNWFTDYQNNIPDIAIQDYQVPELNITDYQDLYPELQPQDLWQTEYMPESYGNEPNFATVGTNEPSLWENIKGGLGEVSGMGKALLPFLLLAAGAKGSSNASGAAKTLQEIAQQQQQQNQEAISRLNDMITSGVGRPDMDSYGLNEAPNLPSMSAIQASQNPYLAQLQAAIADPRFGLQEYMDAEGGRRSEAAARQMARSGRTGLAPMTSLEAMRDYLSKGRPQRIGEMQNLSQLYSQQDIARMQAEAQMQSAQMSGAVSMYNAQMGNAANRYNSDMGYYRDVLNVLQRQADPSNYINTMLASAQAQGQQSNPMLNAIAMFLGRS